MAYKRKIPSEKKGFKTPGNQEIVNWLAKLKNYTDVPYTKMEDRRSWWRKLLYKFGIWR